MWMFICFYVSKFVGLHSVPKSKWQAFLVHDCQFIFVVFFLLPFFVFYEYVLYFCLCLCFWCNVGLTYSVCRMPLIQEVIACGQEVLLVITSSLVISLPDFLLRCGSLAWNVSCLRCVSACLCHGYSWQEITCWKLTSLWEIKKRKKINKKYFQTKKKKRTACSTFRVHGSLGYISHTNMY